MFHHRVVESIHIRNLYSIDTTNILFICGGAFAGIEKVIEKRLANKVIGFGAEVKTKAELNSGELLKPCYSSGFTQVWINTRAYW